MSGIKIHNLSQKSERENSRPHEIVGLAPHREKFESTNRNVLKLSSPDNTKQAGKKTPTILSQVLQRFQL